MIFKVQIYKFLETIRLAFQKQLMGENAITKLEDINNHLYICFSCEYKTGKSNSNYRCTSCNYSISTKIIFTTSECPEGKWKTLDY